MDSGDSKSRDLQLCDAPVVTAASDSFADPSSAIINPEDVGMAQPMQKRCLTDDLGNGDEPATKKKKPEEFSTDPSLVNVEGEIDPEDGSDKKESTSEDDIAPIPPAEEGVSSYGENDVLSGRGGGTNVHPGNRNFRDLINLHRRAYLKARKNDKPAISRAIVRAIRESNGKFLKKDERSGLWFEIGDDAAREKTSQALRQRAPEMRKLLLDAELEEARMAAGQTQQQRMMIRIPGMVPQPPTPVAGPPQTQMAPNPMLMNPAFMAMANKGGPPQNPIVHHMNPDAYGQPMFPGMIYPNGMNRYPQTNPPPS